MTIDPPILEHMCDVVAEIAPPIEVGQTPFGMRRMIPITGGTVSGPSMSGRIVPGGADFQCLFADNTVARLDARYVLELDDGAMIWVENSAMRAMSAENAARMMRSEPVNPDEVYFRCQPRLESAHPDWEWVNRMQFVGAGVRRPTGVFISFYKMI